MSNFSRNTFDKLKHYVGVRLQQGVPLVDADWNEMDDIRKHELQTFLKEFVGSGVPKGNDGFSIAPLAGIANDFTIKGGTAEQPGYCLVEGRDVVIEQDINYTQQKLYNNDALAGEWGVEPLKPLSPPTKEGQTDTVYLDVWEREVDAQEDGNLINPTIGIETCVRLKREWVVRVAEGIPELPNLKPGHVYYPIARLNRKVGLNTIPGEDILDIRQTGLSLQHNIRGTISSTSSVEKATTSHTRQVNVSYDSTASGPDSQVNASSDSTVSSTYSQINASFDSTAGNEYTQVNASISSKADGPRSQVNASYESTASGTYSQVNASQNSTVSGQRSQVNASSVSTASGNESQVNASDNSTASGHYSQINASYQSKATNWRSQVNASLGSTASGAYSQINASSDSTVSGTYSQINASSVSTASGSASQVNASDNSTAIGHYSQINASYQSKATNWRSQVNASVSSTSSGAYSQVNASFDSTAGNEYTQVNASISSKADAPKSQVNASHGSNASGDHSQVNASIDSTSSGSRSQVNASHGSTASGVYSQVNVSSGSTASGSRSQVNASESSMARANYTQVNASYLVINDSHWTICGGYATGGAPSTANRKWEINSSSGNIIHAGSITSSTSFSDYGEYFENLKKGEIDMGLLIALDGAAVRPAKKDEDFIGVVSGTAAIRLGDSPFCWQGRYMKDEWGRPVYHEIKDPAWQPKTRPDEKWKPKEGETEADRPMIALETEKDRPFIRVQKENPDYDPKKEQKPRSERPEEWTLVGLLGQVYVRCDETVQPGDFVKSKNKGLGTKSDEKTKLRAMKVTKPFDGKYSIVYCLLK